MILSKTASVKIGSSNINHFKNKGYNAIFGETITVNVEDLFKKSKIKVDCICDFCEKQTSIYYADYITSTKDSTNLYCCKTCSFNKTKSTMLHKYGVESPLHLKEIKDKIKQTNLEKYGVENVSQLDEIKQKKKNTSLVNYGTEYVCQSQEVRDKIKNTNLERYGVEHIFQSEDVKKKIKMTNLEKYGVEYATQSKEIIDKVKKTNLEKYGTEYVTQSKLIKNKIKVTNLERYSCINPSSNNVVKEKKKLTFYKKYGVTNPFFSEDIKMKIKSTYKENKYKEYKQLLDGSDYSLVDYNINNIKLNHKICCNDFEITVGNFNNRKFINAEYCTICYPINKISSFKEDEVKIWLKSLNVDFLESDRNYIKKELDILIPSKNVAIEFNGLYWHSELFKDQYYHLNKTLSCQDKKINLIHLFEDDWLYKNNIIKSIILNKIGLIQNKIYARKCIVKEVSPKNTMTFLNENHIQGGCKSTYKLGLYHNDELVSLMTFGYRHTNSKKEFELIRFCNKINTNVIGASSKLFKYFLDNYQIDEKYIISYADISMFNGDMYNKLGFEYVHLSKPNYFWVVDKKRHHRFNFNKKKLVKEGFDSSKTEVEIMHERGYYRIFGCGQARWVFELMK